MTSDLKNWSWRSEWPAQRRCLWNAPSPGQQAKNGLTDSGDWLTSAFTFENLSQFYAPSTITSHDTVEFNFGAPAGTYYYKLNNEASYKSFTSTISGGHWVKYWNMNAGNRTFEFYMTSGSLTSKNYTVDFTVTNPPIGTGSPSTATSISAGQTLTGNLAWCYQNDYYSFSATAGARYTLETSGQLDVMLLVLRVGRYSVHQR